MRLTTRRIPASLAAAAAVALLAGCGVKGTPTAAELDVRTLDVGSFAVDKHTYTQTAGNAGALVEGMRMSRAVVPAVAIDPSLVVGQGGRVVASNAEATTRLLAAVSKPILDKENLLAGYTTSGADKAEEPGSGVATSDTTSVTDFVMRFPDAETATRAAGELEDADFGVNPVDNRKLTLPKYHDALIHWRPGINNVGAFLAHKDFVISLFIERPKPDDQDLLAWVGKCFDAQIPALDAFTATPTDQLAGLPLDPDGLLARAVVRDRTAITPDRDRFASYGPNDFIDNGQDEAGRRKLATDTGLDAVAIADTSTVLRVRDAPAAGRLVNGLIAATDKTYESADAPAQLPGTRCLQLSRSGDSTRQFSYRCFVTHGRYVEVVVSNDRSDIRTRADAAYALLANSL
jgi:hypothetical protein